MLPAAVLVGFSCLVLRGKSQPKREKKHTVDFESLNMTKAEKVRGWWRELKTFWIGRRGRHSPIQLQRRGSTLTLQQAPPLPHGHLTCVLSRVEVDRCVIHWWLWRNEDRGGGRGGGGGGWVRDGRRRRWKWRTGVVGGGGGEGRGWGRDERSERGLWGRVFALCSAAPKRSGGLVVGGGGGAGGVSVGMGWRRWMGERHWFYDVWSVILAAWEKSMQIQTKTRSQHTRYWCF